ncbi:MAG: RDD family protein [Deltaproteobacteria bacterium]|nr:RDD family protein [Deltaproteobacteria bacterium]
MGNGPFGEGYEVYGMTALIAQSEIMGDEGAPAVDQGSMYFCGIDYPLYHPWRRFFARTADMLWFLPLLGITITIILAIFSIDSVEIFDMFADTKVLAAIVCYVAWIPLEALFLASWGTTPGKWLFGISVKKSTGVRLLYLAALKRSLLVGIRGYAFEMPLISFFTHYSSYIRLGRTGTTHWDTSVGSMVTHSKWSPVRAIVCTLLVVATFAFLLSAASMQ